MDMLRRGQDRQAAGLEAPELVVVDQVVQMLGQLGAAPLVGAGLLQLPRRLAGEVLQFDPVSGGVLGERCGRQEDGDPDIATIGGQ